MEVLPHHGHGRRENAVGMYPAFTGEKIDLSKIGQPAELCPARRLSPAPCPFLENCLSGTYPNSFIW